ncbi:hypothetical protein L873DRAFT_1416429 [Choiromyces venosus 120613-1]|uniref:Uncharacterized protein n=1 Tax=Choiromyces venosus 120613-1 TaxID=1336337 RepID=A0A3N4J8K9_9PEZI|nr:hypothetical protein L873DRAFT_1416429 [Choiromyces venosus 120613-1]
MPLNLSPNTPPHIRTNITLQSRQKPRQSTMNPRPSFPRNRRGRQPEPRRLVDIPEDQEQNFIHPTEGRGNIYQGLSRLYSQAQTSRVRIERSVSQVSGLAAVCEDYLAQETMYVSDSYFGGVCDADPTEAEQKIQEALSRMEDFHHDLNHKIQQLRISRRRAVILPGDDPSVSLAAANSSGRTGGEISAAGAHGRPRRQEQLISGEAGNDTMVHGYMPPAPPVHLIRFEETTLFPHSPTGSGLRRPLNYSSVVGALRRSAGLARRERVKELWNQTRDRLRNGDPAV